MFISIKQLLSFIDRGFIVRIIMLLIILLIGVYGLYNTDKYRINSVLPYKIYGSYHIKIVSFAKHNDDISRSIAVIKGFTPYHWYYNQFSKTPYIPLNGRILARSMDGNILHYNQEYVITGSLQALPNYPQGYKKYLQTHKIEGIISSKNVLICVDNNHKYTLIERIYTIRMHLEDMIRRALRYPYSDIAMGMLFGTNTTLPDSLQDSFLKASLQHILVVSGYNVMLLLYITSLFLKRFGYPIMIITSLIILLLYIILTGSDVAAVRAGLMGAVSIASILLSRRTDIRHILLFIVIIMSLYEPTTLFLNTGFQLSITATMGIILLYPYYERLVAPCLQRLPAFIIPLLGVSLIAQLSLFPLLISTFGTIPLFSIPINMLIEPLVPLIMIASSILIPAYLLPFVALKIIAIPAYILLLVLVKIASLASYLPSITLPNSINTVLLIIWYSVFIILLVRKKSILYIDKT